jgi:hypothetical protein
MKKTLFIILFCVILLSMPTVFALPITNKDSQFTFPLKMSDGTFVGGLGRGHWGNGKFNIDNVYAYMNGVYTSSFYLKISGDLTKNYGKFGEISAYIIANKIIFGYVTNNNGQRTTIFGILMKNENNQFVGRILISSMPTPYMWGLLIPTK